MRPLDCLYRPLDEIDAALDAFASSPDEVRDLSLQEIAALIEFEHELRGTCDALKRVIDATERRKDIPTRGGCLVKSIDHPVIQKILNRRRDATDRAANIRRQHVQAVKK